MRRNRYISGAIIFALLMHTSFALNFTIEASYPEKIPAGEKVIGTLKITNYGEESFFTLSVAGPKPEWIVFEKPSLLIPKGESKSVKVYIKPSENAYEAVYKFRLRAVAEDGTTKEVLFPIKVEQTEKLRFSNISISCVNSICSPGEKVKFSVKIVNLGRDERSLNVRFIFEGKKIEHKIIVEGRSDKSVSAEFLLDKYQNPGKYNIKLQIIEAGEKIFEGSTTFTVKKIEKLEKNEKENVGFFTKEVVINVKNEGNMEKEYTISSNATEGWLIVYSGEKAERVDGKYVWKIKLKPGESVVIAYREIFLFRILIIVVIAAVIIYLKFFYVWGIKVKKNVIYKAPVKEGDKISVSIEISASKPAKKIVVRDFVPLSFELVKSFETVKPIRKEREDGIELIWKIRSMKPGEERVLHYKLRSKIGVIGPVALPKASVECELEGKRTIKKSNSPKIVGIKE